MVAVSRGGTSSLKPIDLEVCYFFKVAVPCRNIPPELPKELIALLGTSAAAGGVIWFPLGLLILTVQ